MVIRGCAFVVTPPLRGRGCFFSGVIVYPEDVSANARLYSRERVLTPTTTAAFTFIRTLYAIWAMFMCIHYKCSCLFSVDVNNFCRFLSTRTSRDVNLMILKPENHTYYPLRRHLNKSRIRFFNVSLTQQTMMA